MALSNLDTFENRKALEKWMKEQGTLSSTNHGYNSIEEAIVTDVLGKVQTKWNGYSHEIQLKINHPLNNSGESVLVFIASTKEYESAIHTLIDEFFAVQTKIEEEAEEDAPDEQYVLNKVQRIQDDYRKACRVIQPVEVIVDIYSFTTKMKKTTVKWYVDFEDRIAVDKISAYMEERQVIVLPFDKWFPLLEKVDPEEHRKIKHSRELAEKQVQF